MKRIGMFSFRHRRLVALAWPLLLVALLAIASAVGGDFRQSFALPGSEAQQAADRLHDAGFESHGGHEGQVVVAAPDVTTAAVRDAFESYLATVTSAVEGVSVSSPYGDAPKGAISEDRTVAFAAVDFGDVPLAVAQERAAEVFELQPEALLAAANVQVEFGGDVFAEESEFSSEGIGLVAAALILLVAFGSLLAMGLPIVSALLGIGCGMAVVTMSTGWIHIPPFAPATVAMIGIGVGIDYALFIVTRFREELYRGADPEEATRVAMDTAGHSTVFAGATVVTSLLGLLVIGLDDVRSLALAAAAGVGFVMLSSITLLPALLGFVGHNIDRLGLPHRQRLQTRDVEESFWYRWSRLVQRRPAVVSVASLALLLFLATPVMSLRLGLADASTRPTTDTTRRAHDLLVDGFGPGSMSPLIVAASVPGNPEVDLVAAEGLRRAIERDQGVASVSPALPGDDNTTAMFVVTPTTGLQDPGTSELVQRIRNDIAAAALPQSDSDVLVGGPAAAAVDFAAHNSRMLPLFISVVLGLSFLVLTVLFRSILVPLKAVIVNLISVGAAYGVVVVVFQWGWLGNVLSIGEPGPIEAWVPMMLFAIVFGLSIDYEVFLLSRIREMYDQTGDNAQAVADGLARTARLIAAAAAIMVCVFGAFALSSERALQMLGLGLAVAIAVDATIVRLVLVPATMELLGDRNWWVPKWLATLLPSPEFEDDDVRAGAGA